MNFPVYPESAARESVRTLPRLTSDEYLAFVTELLAHADPVKVARQKALEERIEVPFSLAPEGAGEVCPATAVERAGKTVNGHAVGIGVPMPIFTRNILWDVNPETFDIQKGRRLVVQRVLTYGTLNDLHLLKTLYSPSEIRNEVLRIKDWDSKVLNFISLWLDIPREQFACCAHRHSHPKHWN